MPDAQLNKEAIEAHNRLRVKHGCGPLTYDAGLAQTAQTWAEKLSERGAMQHSGSKVYGENLAYRKSTGAADMNGEEATDYWYSEIEQHNFDRNEFQMDSGHFTQVVWKDTTHAGFGKAKSKDGHSVYVVGQYTPPGNVQGMFQTNVSIPGVKVVVGKSGSRFYLSGLAECF
ncbi:unnamed protein product [Calicophoron daubneyi]|uniref:SCP domain-containing protein n=1 Tax=Calicophoron daubneyi TaxID=300641 RepID=A0AAV2TE70_CALDB